MSKKILCFLICLCSLIFVLEAQNAKTLEAQLAKATDKNEQMTLNYRIAQEYKNSDAAKTSDFAHKAYIIASELNDNGMMAKSAFLNAEGFLKRRDVPNAKGRFGRALKHAKDAKDLSLALDCLKQLSDLALKEKDFREAFQNSQEAIDLLKNSKGIVSGSSSKINNDSEVKVSDNRKAMAREVDRLQQQNRDLQNKLDDLSKERDHLSGDKAKLADTQRQLEKNKEEAMQALSEKDKAVKNMSREKLEAEYVSEKKQRILESLESKSKLQNIELERKNMAIQKSEQAFSYWRNLSILAGLSILGIGGLFYSRYQEKQKANKELAGKNKIIQEERERSDELLLNVLPAPIAQELKENGKAVARKYDNATVLFTDFKNFTQIAEKLTPEQLVNELDRYFKGFDFIISQYGIEKIKTIGDAYMCASGLSDRLSSPTLLVKAAVEIQQFMEEIKAEKISKGEPYLEARIGIHTGPVVAGVVGNKKFAYDIWGDTVNLAARMEQNCEPGRINISETTYWQVKYDFDCTSRGRIHAKNKGELEMYYVNRRV